MPPKIDTITLGVTDPEAARRFYELGLGARVRDDGGTLAVGLGPNASRVALRGWDTVASDAGVEPATSGFRAFTLSYILESAEEVDAVMARAEAHGATIARAPKGAFWGYGGYVTDPAGYLWKITAAKRRPLLGRRAAPADGRPVAPRAVPITIGVADVKRAKAFYAEGIGLPVKKAFGSKFVTFSGEDGTSDLGMYAREALAGDAAVAPEGHGFHGFSITHVVASAERVDALLGRAAGAGGSVLRTPAANGRGYRGSFADLDGNVWEVAARG